MDAKKLNFHLTVANEYRQRCPELSRMMMVKCSTTAQGSLLAEFLENYRGKLCEHCGTVFTASNCSFRIKPRRKRRKKRIKSSHLTACDKIQTGRANYDDNLIPKRSNSLQISCKHCGWKTRLVGTDGSKRECKDNRGTRTSTGGSPMPITPNVLETPKLLGSKTQYESPSFSVTPKSSVKGSGLKKKGKTKLKELLAMEREAADKKTLTSPSLLNFLASV